MQVYIKNEAGEYAEATDSQIEELFQTRSEKIVAKKLATAREKELERIRPELEEQIRKESLEKLTTEATEKAREDVKTQLDALTKERDDLSARLRRKTIAAEYGFKPETEEFLGTGTDEEMRAKADTLKNSFGPSSSNATFPDKKGADSVGTDSFVTLGNQ